MYHGKHSKNNLTFNNLRRRQIMDNKRINVVSQSCAKLACFSSHEARGTGSVVRYLAEKF